MGDLGHTGDPYAVLTSVTGRVYMFDAEGHLQSGWPKTLDLGVAKPPIPRPTLRTPACRCREPWPAPSCSRWRAARRST